MIIYLSLSEKFFVFSNSSTLHKWMQQYLYTSPTWVCWWGGVGGGGGGGGGADDQTPEVNIVKKIYIYC